MTGTLFAPVLQPLIQLLNARYGTQLSVAAVENNYFGGDVSVAGLLTGGDFVAAKGKIRGDFVIIPRTTLKSDEEIFLDGMKLEDVSEQFGCPVYPLDLKAFSQFLVQQN